MCCIPCILGYCACKLACKIISAVISILVLVGIIVLIVLLTKKSDDTKGALGVASNEYYKAAVVANGAECANIGKNILLKGGSAADAAIATLFCDGVSCGQCMGLGGGFLMTVYTRATGRVEFLNAREVAAQASTEDMFQGGSISTTEGGLAAAVPGELRGYEELFKKYGSKTIQWKELVQPTIDLCKNGYAVTPYLARILKDRKEKILNEPTLNGIFINPETNDVWNEGELIKRPDLAATLEIIAAEGADALYNGRLTKPFVDDIKSFKGIITEKDMNDYRPKWADPLKISLGTDHDLYTVSLPGSGHVVAFIINALRGWVFPENIGDKRIPDVEENGVTYWHRIVEIFKYAYARRTGLGDADFLPDDKIQPLLNNMTSIEYAHHIRTLIKDYETHNNWTYYGADVGLVEDGGTAHISVIAPNGDAVSVTSTINYILGAFRRSPQTGIILNNEMDDFSYPNITNIYGLPPSPNNFPKPGKRPMSSMTPSLVIQKGRGARLVLGAAGGTKISTQVALLVMKHLFSGEDIYTAMDAPRLHHQLFPMEIQHEYDFDTSVLEALRRIGHKTSSMSPTAGFAAAIAISANRTSGLFETHTDRRRPGSHAGY